MKKSYGKVHRYRTAFGHTAGFWVRRVGLLAAAGLGVAMGNAPAEVQRAANLVTGANTESGAACAIRRFLLGESD